MTGPAPALRVALSLTFGALATSFLVAAAILAGWAGYAPLEGLTATVFGQDESGLICQSSTALYLSLAAAIGGVAVADAGVAAVGVGAVSRARAWLLLAFGLGARNLCVRRIRAGRVRLDDRALSPHQLLLLPTGKRLTSRGSCGSRSRCGHKAPLPLLPQSRSPGLVAGLAEASGFEPHNLSVTKHRSRLRLLPDDLGIRRTVLATRHRVVACWPTIH
jgi:hypothetical protein